MGGIRPLWLCAIWVMHVCWVVVPDLAREVSTRQIDVTLCRSLRSSFELQQRGSCRCVLPRLSYVYKMATTHDVLTTAQSMGYGGLPGTPVYR